MDAMFAGDSQTYEASPATGFIVGAGVYAVAYAGIELLKKNKDISERAELWLENMPMLLAQYIGFFFADPNKTPMDVLSLNWTPTVTFAAIYCIIISGWTVIINLVPYFQLLLTFVHGWFLLTNLPLTFDSMMPIKIWTLWFVCFSNALVRIYCMIYADDKEAVANVRSWMSWYCLHAADINVMECVVKSATNEGNWSLTISGFLMWYYLRVAKPEDLTKDQGSFCKMFPGDYVDSFAVRFPTWFCMWIYTCWRDWDINCTLGGHIIHNCCLLPICAYFSWHVGSEYFWDLRMTTAAAHTTFYYFVMRYVDMPKVTINPYATPWCWFMVGYTFYMYRREIQQDIKNKYIAWDRVYWLTFAVVLNWAWFTYGH